MSQTITSRTISAVVDKRLVLTNGQGKRLFSYLTTWNVIRIGLHFSMDGSGAANITGTPLFALGIMSGTTNGVGNTTTSHFLGIRSVSATWTYNAGAGNPYFSEASSMQQYKRVNTTNTDSAGSSALTPFWTANPGSKRNVIILEITKGSPNFTVAVIGPASAAAAQADITLATFEDMMNAVTMAAAAAIPSVAYTAGTSRTVAIDEATSGFFNAINFYWNKSVGMEVCAVAHRKIS